MDRLPDEIAGQQRARRRQDTCGVRLVGQRGLAVFAVIASRRARTRSPAASACRIPRCSRSPVPTDPAAASAGRHPRPADAESSARRRPRLVRAVVNCAAHMYSGVTPEAIGRPALSWRERVASRALSRREPWHSFLTRQNLFRSGDIRVSLIIYLISPMSTPTSLSSWGALWTSPALGNGPANQDRRRRIPARRSSRAGRAAPRRQRGPAVGLVTHLARRGRTPPFRPQPRSTRAAGQGRCRSPLPAGSGRRGW